MIAKKTLDPDVRYPFTCSPVFDMVMRDKELCRRFLERVLGTEVGEVDYHAVEHEIVPGLGARGVRLDAYLKADGAVYDVEMQAAPEPALGKRISYYLIAMGAAALKAGLAFVELPDSYVIFVCDHDPYERNIPVYDFEVHCVQDGTVDPGIGFHARVLNARAWEGEPDEALRDLLRYISDGGTSDELTHELDTAVDRINDDPERRAEVAGFMTLEISIDARERVARKEGREEGLVEGEAIGEVRHSALVDKLLDDGRIEDIRRSSKDADFLQQLYREYGL